MNTMHTRRTCSMHTLASCATPCKAEPGLTHPSEPKQRGNGDLPGGAVYEIWPPPQGRTCQEAPVFIRHSFISQRAREAMPQDLQFCGYLRRLSPKCTYGSFISVPGIVNISYLQSSKSHSARAHCLCTAAFTLQPLQGPP